MELVLEYAATPEAFYERVRQLTGVGDAATLAELFSAAIVRTPVMTSMTRIGKDTYRDGHIVTLYGVARQPVSPTPVVVLNPAVKVASRNRIACDIDDVPNDERWSAIVSLEDSYELKAFNGRYLVMWLRRLG